MWNAAILNVGPMWDRMQWYTEIDITLLPAWGYDPLQPGDMRGSQWGVRTTFYTKENNRFHCLKSGPLKGLALLGTALRNEGGHRKSYHHCNGYVVILMKFPSLATPEVVILTTSGSASDENFIKMTTFPFQWWSFITCLYHYIYHDVYSLATTCDFF